MLTVIFDIASILFAIIGFIFAFKLWSSLGRHGITWWLLAAMIWAIILRLMSIGLDIGLKWNWLNYARQSAFPLYLFLTLGFWGLFNQVKNKLEGNGHKTSGFIGFCKRIFRVE
jgi:hypothetical protein